MMKRSQTKKISAMLAAMAVLWGGTLTFGGDSVSAAERYDWDRMPNANYRAKQDTSEAMLTQILEEVGRSDSKTKAWFIKTMGALYRPYNEEKPDAPIPNSFYIRFPGSGGMTTGTLHFVKRSENTVDIGSGNVYLDSPESTEDFDTVFGAKNTYTRGAYILGSQNIGAGDRSVAIGRDNRAFGTSGVAIGYASYAGIAKEDNGEYGKQSDSVAIGNRSWAGSNAIAMGSQTLSMGSNAIAIGNGAKAGYDPDKFQTMLDFGKKVRGDIPAPWAYESQPVMLSYYLMQAYPEFFDSSAYDPSTGKPITGTAFKTVSEFVFDKYATYFKSMGVTSYEELDEIMGGSDQGSQFIENLAWQYVFEHSNIESPTALGDEAAAYGNHSLALGYKSTVGFGTDGAVALGANSLVTLDDMVGDGTKAPFSNINLSTQGTAVNGINEYLLGPVAIGGKDKDSTTKVYLRQLKYVADGTADTDAVNLRQLKAAVGNSGTTGGGDDNGGSGNSDSTIVYEAGDNITITDGKNDHTKVISATGITDIKNQVTDLNGRVDKVEDSMNTMNHRITKLDRRVDKVGAGAAALAALHPLDFDPDNKWDIAGGYGHYAGQSAMALGAYYRPNEDVMFSIGGAFGNGEDMINAGVSIKVGSGESKSTTSKVAMAKKINELETNMAKQETEIQELKELVKKLSK